MSRLAAVVVMMVIASTCATAPVVPDFMLELLDADKPLADVVRSISPFKIATIDGQSSEMRKEIQSLSFRIPETVSAEILTEAQLKIYASIHNRRRSYYGIERLLQVTLRTLDEKSSVNVEASPTTLMQIYLKRNTWLSVNMSQSFRAWRQLGRAELLVHLHVLNPYTNVGATGDLEFNLDKEQRLEPFLLLLYDLETRPTDPQPPLVHNVSKRSIPFMDFKEVDDYEEETNNIWDDDLGVRSAAALHTTTTSTTPEPKIQAASKTNKNLCRRKPLYVDFTEIQYDSWVLAPAGYEAFQCAGRCVYPISDHLAPTKHAVIQTLVHSLSAKRAQKACCVPTKLKPISMLYLDDDGVLTYRLNYEDMVVAECGCR